MVDQILLYISAAGDLVPEREALSQAVVEIPVTLGWRIIQSPHTGEPVNPDAVTAADVHLLLLGSDIRAPIGLEWLYSRRVGRLPVLFLKQDIQRTMAAQNFMHHIEAQTTWHLFKNSSDLSQQVLKLLASHILERANYYALSTKERDRLTSWQDELNASGTKNIEDIRGGVGESSVILSPERYIPSEGVLIQPKEGD
jgi:hypothetical protein